MSIEDGGAGGPPGAPSPGGAGGGHVGDSEALGRLVHGLHEHIEKLERLVSAEGRSVEARVVPAWQRATAGEHRLPVAGFVAVAIVLQVVLPPRYFLGPRLVPVLLEAVLALGLVAANPRRIDRSSRTLRGASLLLIATISVANAWSAVRLIDALVSGGSGPSAPVLLGSGAAIYVTNIIVFGLWYWECDRAGPVARAHGDRPYPDLLFPQMGGLHLAPPDWRPTFVDYLYVSYTNATAFSPTDTMPMARWTKLLFLAQSAIALAVAALVIARAVNILR